MSVKLSAILEPLLAAGVDADVILKTVRAFEEQQEASYQQSREKARERWRRWKANQTSTNVSKRLPTHANGSRGGDARGEDNLPDKVLSGEDKKTNTNAPKARESDLSAFKGELSDLDPERLEAIVKHRRSKRGQLTAHAARLFRSDAAVCGLSLPEAVDTCISRNWITVKPEYLAGRSRQATSPPPRERTVSDALAEMAAGTWKGPPGLRTTDEPDFPTIETSFARRD